MLLEEIINGQSLQICLKWKQKRKGGIGRVAEAWMRKGKYPLCCQSLQDVS